MQENKRYKGLKTGKWISIRSLVLGLLLTVRSARTSAFTLNYLVHEFVDINIRFHRPFFPEVRIVNINIVSFFRRCKTCLNNGEKLLMYKGLLMYLLNGQTTGMIRHAYFSKCRALTNRINGDNLCTSF